MKENKTVIILAALELFGEKGFSKVSIKEIAKLAEVSQVTIYNNFANKEELVKEVIAVLMEDVSKAAEEIYSSNLPYEEKLTEIFAACNKDKLKSIEKYFSSESLADPKLAGLISQAMNAYKEKIYEEFIDLGYQLGELPKSIDKRSILFLLRALNSSGLAIDSDLAHHNLSQDLVQLFLYGIFGKEKNALQALTGEDVLKMLTAQVKNELEKGEE